MEKIMSQTHSQSHQQAEIAFSNAQTQFFARNSAVEELDSLVRSREEKTLRLREAVGKRGARPCDNDGLPSCETRPEGLTAAHWRGCLDV